MTREARWTPGPWDVVPLSGVGGPYSIRMAMPAGSKYPTHYGIQSVGTEANARLTAAAPDLYEALQAAPVLSKYHGLRGFETVRFIADYEAWMVARRSVLAKARGEAA